MDHATFETVTELLPPEEAPDASAGRDGPTNLGGLPKEVGVMLLSAGVVGFVLPGPGTPAIIAGGLVLWPDRFGKVEVWFERKFPAVHQGGMKYIRRFLSDMERRYPGTTR